MKQKKQSKNWYIAAILWLAAAFIIPLLIFLILGFPVAMIMSKNNPAFYAIAMSIIWFFSIYFGTIYTARYVNNTYIIKNSDNIAKLATIYMVVLEGGSRSLKLLKGFDVASMVDSVFFIIGIAVFYILSKKYIKNSEEMAVIQ